jgi:hypothetical protein
MGANFMITVFGKSWFKRFVTNNENCATPVQIYDKEESYGGYTHSLASQDLITETRRNVLAPIPFYNQE